MNHAACNEKIVYPHGGNCTPDVIEALASAPADAVIRFQPEQYDFYAGGTFEDMFFPACNRSGTKKVVFPVLWRKNLTIDGGARFVFHDRVFPFIVQHCRGVTLRNFSVDFSFRRYCACRVISADDEGIRLDLSESGCRYDVNEAGNLVIGAGSEYFSTCERRFFLEAG